MVYATRGDSPGPEEIRLKILVTGHVGFIGFHLAKRLLDGGEMVVGLIFSKTTRQQPVGGTRRVH